MDNRKHSVTEAQEIITRQGPLINVSKRKEIGDIKTATLYPREGDTEKRNIKMLRALLITNIFT